LADITNKTVQAIVAAVTKHNPTLMAQQLVNVQPMPPGTGRIFDLNGDFARMFAIIETKQVDGKMVYSVTGGTEILDWVQETFVSGADYTLVRNLKGVWVDVNEDVLMLLKLKWA
jgi:hypothetical protein